MAFLIRLLFFGICLAMTFMSVPAKADDTLQLHEQEIEAGLIYNFLKYIDWPKTGEARQASVIVCIFGNDPFKGYLQPIVGRTVNQRRIDVRNIQDFTATSDCDLLFVSASEKNRWPELAKYISGKNILTVSNFDDFARTGGMVEFGHADNHIRVSLNINAVNAAKLRVEDRLLKLVTLMQPVPGDGQ